jgi:uncharacterized protein YciI/uncharacterized protein YndB with AHSA1/START domain
MAAIALLRPARAGFHLDPTVQELQALGAHLELLKRLAREGRVVVAGPCEDGSLGVAIFPTDDAAAAQALMADDPCVKAGVMSCEVHPFRMSVFGTGTTRDWTGFTQAIHIRAERTALWRMLTTCVGLESWFLARAEAWTADGREWPRDRTLEPGQKLRLTWGIAGDCAPNGTTLPADISEDDTVLAVEPPQRIRLGWYQDKGWVDIRLLEHPSDGRITVELEQRLADTGDHAFLENAFVGCKEGWAFFLTNLKCIAEGGPDLRERQADRKGLVNL